ncbi:MAG: ATP-binding cassette domain-containing protein, partial [Chitinophagaceae bacterium]|nr:ATP-binding cassette domain-containing protein [Chitinophagaceae bacterium]
MPLKRQMEVKMSEKLLEIKNVSKSFHIGGMLSKKKLVAVDEVNIDIDAGKPIILSIVGESGCGKSTLCKMILRLHDPDQGDIVLSGRSYKNRKGYDPFQFRLDVQPIFQNPYESFSMRKTVDTYLFNTALRLK